ncbi:MAG TPA: metallophosphoesterase [Chitinophagaceae bacterium]|nr:metallophosphoesterase [Chitinophagaceae bacterium]
MKQIFPALLLSCSLFAATAQNKKADDLFIAKPYLQAGHTPAPGSLALLWHTPDTDADWTVEEKTGPNSAWVKTAAPIATRINAAGLAAHRVYRAPLTGLVAGSTFNYRVLRNGKPVFSSEALAPKSAAQPFRFVVFGDIGAGTTEAKAMALRAYQSKPDLVVVPGDIIYENGLVSEYQEKFWPIYNADKADTAGVPLMRSVPFVAAPGNHDTENRDLDKYPDGLAYYLFWDQPLNGPAGMEGGPFVPALKGSEANRKAFTDAAGDAYPRMTNFSYDYGNAHWVFIDANTYVDWTDKTLKDWVAKDLANAKDAAWRFVVFHHPGFSSSREHFEQQHMRLLAPIFEAGKVDIVFNGHVHNYQRSFPLSFVPDKQGTLLVGGKDNKTIRGRVVNGRWTLDKTFNGQSNTHPQGVIYMVTGAGGQELYNPEQNNDPDSWQKFTDKFISSIHSLTVAEVDGKTLTVRQVSADGKELDSFRITK